MTQLSTRLELTRSRRDANAFEWLEIVLAILAVPMVGALITPNDPFFNQASFPWGALGPLIIALRHGSARGLIAAAALIGLNALAADSTWMQDAGFSREIALGTVLIALIGGIWSDAYAQRLEAEQTRSGYQTQRLNDFAQNYHALRISHDRLEYRLAGSVVSCTSLTTPAGSTPVPPPASATPSPWTARTPWSKPRCAHANWST